MENLDQSPFLARQLAMIATLIGILTGMPEYAARTRARIAFL